MSEFRVRRRGKLWGVQERTRWRWRWIGQFGGRASFWAGSAGALWFANLCERFDARHDAAARDAGRVSA